ncbi:hypothetical protein [uncultured Vibrio sp.]|uniref:hypothetical protein n=1 Tax=uncultured Vibrio sp. TaxID=114054 RepID=UPI0026198BFC|nr:hypothetical protein [uncultured Vibrio sp.]
MRYHSSPVIPEERQETTREREARQFRERQEELRYTASDEMRWKENRERVLLDRQEAGLGQISQGFKMPQILSDSIGLQCSLESEMAKNHQHVLIADLEDAHKILHNVWLEAGKNAAMIATSLNYAKSWFSHVEPVFDARSIAKQFGDMGVKADLVESKGKTFVAFSGTDKNGKVLQHAFVNGTRINMNGKKYPLNSFKSMQAGFSPQSRASNFKGAGVLTFVVSASIATSDLVFKDDYHLVDWFGNVGSDMFKFLIQVGAGEALLFAVASFNLPILFGALAVCAAYVAVEVIWGEYNIAGVIVKELESAIQN